MVEQLLPVYSWEKVWYTAPTPHRIAGDHYRILSNTAGNLVSIQLDDGTFLPQVQVPTAADFAEVSWVTLWYICEPFVVTLCGWWLYTDGFKFVQLDHATTNCNH